MSKRTPVPYTSKTTLRGLVEAMQDVERPGPEFADDLEAIRNEQNRWVRDPWADSEVEDCDQAEDPE